MGMPPPGATPSRVDRTALAYVETPIGVVRLEASREGLVSARFVALGPLAEVPASSRPVDAIGARPLVEAPTATDAPESPPLRVAAAELAEYFAERRRAFTAPLDPRGTAFQLDVWSLLLRVPFGATTTYGRLASELGGTTSARAVGAAVAANPIAIVIPCHRVLGARGNLTGYGGGLDRKEWLLRHEGVTLL